MKRQITIMAGIVMLLMSCSSGRDSTSGADQLHELSLRQQMAGTIASEGEVDWYHYRVVESNNVLQIRCTSDTLRPDVDLLVSVFEEDEDGNKVLIYSDHAPDGGLQPADLTLNVFIDRPKDIYISVRDLVDDDFSDNPYYLTIDFGGAAEGNDNFTQAAPLTVGSSDCPVDGIGSVGDVDCFRFSSNGGIYDVHVDFSPLPDSPVQLSISLYDGDGNRLENRSSRSINDYHLVHYLSAGDYYVNIEDFGRDHFDSASPYQICVQQTTGVEAGQNDGRADAAPVDLSAYDQEAEISGSLDYNEDQDWYLLSTPAAASGFRVLNVQFQSDVQMSFHLSIQDENGTSLMSHTYLGGMGTYRNQVKLDTQTGYLVVQPASGQSVTVSGTYSATVKAQDVLDDAEVAPNDNDSAATADALSFTSDPAAGTQGKIGYRTDVDWYAATVPAHADPQVIEFFFEAPVSQVEYSMSIFRNQLEKKIYNMDAENTATKLQTSLLVPPSDQEVTYTIKIGDYHDDDGDDGAYTIRVDLQDIPVALPAAAAGSPIDGQSVTYYNEADESTVSTVEVSFNSLTQTNFGYDDTLLDFSSAVVQTDTPSAGLTTLTFPWIGGYVDYQGDYDFFQIGLEPYDSATSWYYDIQVELYTPGGDVEYVWKFFPDREDDREIQDRPRWWDGFLASAGDDDPDAQAVHLVTPSNEDDPFWIGDGWSGNSFFSISDFNYLEDENGDANPEPDEDWGGYNLAPYYFRIVLVYHPGVSSPE